jgi:hypothetical protein
MKIRVKIDKIEIEKTIKLRIVSERKNNVHKILVILIRKSEKMQASEVKK